MEEKITCYECGSIIEEGEEKIWYEAEQDYICQDCYDDNYYTCDECGEVIHIDNSRYINDWIYCDNCFNDNFTRCECCGEYTLNSDLYDTEDGRVCQCCYEDYYIECADCGAIIHRDAAHYDEVSGCDYCGDCVPIRTIRPYSYKPSPIFSGTDILYMGIELEIDEGGTDDEKASKILNINDLLYCKYDSSLTDGFEIVSHPCDLNYHMSKMHWAEILQTCQELGYTSHDAETCGLHIHVNRKALGIDEKAQENTIQNILYFVEDNWNKMLTFSRRTQNQLDRWASRYGLLEGENPSDILKKAKSGCGRYKAINLLNTNTIEFRLYRGTLNAITFFATLQLTNYICKFCKQFTEEEQKAKSWSDFINYISGKEHTEELLNYLKKRGI